MGGESSCRSSVLSSSGQCSCKMNVQGRQCSECVDGFYGLELNNPNGCSGGNGGSGGERTEGRR